MSLLSGSCPDEVDYYTLRRVTPSRGDASAAFADELKELEATRAYNQRLLKFHSDSCER